MNKTNFHTHNYRCEHAVGNVEDYVKVAIREGYTELGISDHAPMPEYYENNRMKEEDFDGYLKEIEEAQEKYGNKLCEKYNGIRSQVSIYETMPYKADKSSAIKKLAERLGIKREEVMAMGDGNNDVEMLKYAGVSVAMGNSTEDALKAAKAIEKYILGK